MPRYKLSDPNKKKLLYVWRDCPCIKKSTLAYIFDISPSRVGEVIREDDQAIERRRKAEEMVGDICG